MATGQQLKLAGMLHAVDHANQCVENWSEVAYNFLQKYAKKNQTFLAEEVRNLAEESGEVPYPPSKRAWGGIFNRAKGQGLIKSLGVKQVTNPKAHQAYATHWGSLIK